MCDEINKYFLKNMDVSNYSAYACRVPNPSVTCILFMMSVLGTVDFHTLDLFARICCFQ